MRSRIVSTFFPNLCEAFGFPSGLAGFRPGDQVLKSGVHQDGGDGVNREHADDAERLAAHDGGDQDPRSRNTEGIPKSFGLSTYPSGICSTT